MWTYVKITQIMSKYLGRNILGLTNILSLLKLSPTNVSLH